MVPSITEVNFQLMIPDFVFPCCLRCLTSPEILLSLRSAFPSPPQSYFEYVLLPNFSLFESIVSVIGLSLSLSYGVTSFDSGASFTF